MIYSFSLDSEDKCFWGTKKYSECELTRLMNIVMRLILP